MAKKNDVPLVDEQGYSQPLSQKQLISLIRTIVRKQWMRHPTKLSFIELKQIPETDPKQRRKHKIQCNCCKQYFTKSQTQVDHIKGNIPFTDLSQSFEYACAILNVCYDDIQILCKACHEIKTYSEKHNISFDEARIIKQVIQIFEDKQEFNVISSYGITPASNKPKRKLQLIELLSKN